MEAAGIDLGRFDTGRWKGAAGASSSSLSWDSLLTKDQSLSSKSEVPRPVVQSATWRKSCDPERHRSML